MPFLLIIYFCIPFTVNIYFNVEILHILEKYCVGIRYSFFISALKMACPVKQFLFSSSTAYRNEYILHNLPSIFECYQKVFYLPSFEGFILIVLFSIFCFSDTHFLSSSFFLQFCAPQFFYLSLLLPAFCYPVHLPLKRRQVIVKGRRKTKWMWYGLHLGFSDF